MNARGLCLALLSVAPMSGYELRRLVAEGRVAHFAEASFGSIYPALDRLEGEGLVTAHEERAAGKPPRRVFTITPPGRAALVAMLHEPVGADVYRSPFLLVAAMAPLVQREHLERALDARIAWTQDELARMRDERREALATDCAEAANGWLWTLDYGLCLYEASLGFLERERARLVDLASQGQPAIAPPDAPIAAGGGRA